MESRSLRDKGVIRKTRIITTLGKVYTVPPEIGLKVRRAMLEGIQHVALDGKGKVIIKVSTIAEVDEIYERLPQTDNLLKAGERGGRVDVNSPAYKTFRMKVEELRKKVVAKKKNL